VEWIVDLFLLHIWEISSPFFSSETSYESFVISLLFFTQMLGCQLGKNQLIIATILPQCYIAYVAKNTINSDRLDKDSLVSTVTRVRSAPPRNWSWIWGWEKRCFSSSQCPHWFWAHISIGIRIRKTNFCSTGLTAKVLPPVSFCNIFNRLIFPINLLIMS
jgi:hypothetical protein